MRRRRSGERAAPADIFFDARARGQHRPSCAVRRCPVWVGLGDRAPASRVRIASPPTSNVRAGTRVKFPND
jgi:hypothetical protein